MDSQEIPSPSNHGKYRRPYDVHLSRNDDMPAHIKASLLGTQLTLAVEDGRLATGTWQGIWLGEHRDHGGSRRLLVTLFGE
ncbi:secondary thiamine-phosphate synthase enzyme YjbQ [Carnimonas nigrificans]|uniref:secondary thiamine-phosphate synthase enzyme YjbQ n=1 Tax=Carnimonas nigrificans TaxID=64323 RepID=UPI00046EC7F8|nr:secondary thiamine-phosphate synthase enzyme YjbQ [Carnimonas nigrificans]